MEILHSESVVVNRTEADMDRACDEAYRQAVMVLGIDGHGYSRRVKGWDRSACWVRVVFEGYEHGGSMTGHTHTYWFRAEAARGEA